MEAIDVAKKIESKISMIQKMRGQLAERAEKKSIAIANYDKNIALTIIKLRNGIEMIFENEIIKDPPATIMEKIAKGICWQEKLELEITESSYKSLITNIECVQAELNGLQSINKYLDKL